MKKNNKSKGILITAIIAVLAVITIAAILIYNKNKDNTGMNNNNPSAIDLTGYSNSGDIIIRSASYIYSADGKIEGYLVTVSSKGYSGDILMDVTFDDTGKIVKSVVIKDQKEPEGYGDKITDEAFLNQFNGISAPVSLSGDNTSNTAGEVQDTKTETADANTSTTDGETEENTTSSGTVWSDGTYETEEAEFDDQGYKDKVTLTIKDGKMTEVIWDAYNAAGQLKSVLSADGAYEMTRGGLTWQEQAVAIADFVVQNQSTDAIITNEEGKTDSVSGVSISVNDFITLVIECLEKASAQESLTETGEEPTTDNSAGTDTSDITPTADDSNKSGQVDAVSGATVSSTAVVSGVNKAYSFIQDFVLTK